MPRANHRIRAIPPDVVAEYARAHDDSIWATFLDIVGYEPRPLRGHVDRPEADQLPQLDRDNFAKGKGEGKGRGERKGAGVPHAHESAANVAAEVGVAPEQAEGGGSCTNNMHSSVLVPLP